MTISFGVWAYDAPTPSHSDAARVFLLGKSVGAGMNQAMTPSERGLLSHLKPRLSQIAVSMMWLAKSTLAAAAVYGDPQGSGVIVGAMNWLQGTLLGTVATVAAVIAVAMVGFLMLSGRMNWRHGTIVILGCFILFGATSIVAGIRASAAGF